MLFIDKQNDSHAFHLELFQVLSTYVCLFSNELYAQNEMGLRIKGMAIRSSLNT